MPTRYRIVQPDGTICTKGPGCRLHDPNNTSGSEYEKLRAEFETNLAVLAKRRIQAATVTHSRVFLSREELVATDVERAPTNSLAAIQIDDGSYDYFDVDDLISPARFPEDSTFVFFFNNNSQSTLSTPAPIAAVGQNLQDVKESLLEQNREDIALLRDNIDEETEKGIRRRVLQRFNAVDAIENGARVEDYAKIVRAAEYLADVWEDYDPETVQQLVSIADVVEERYPNVSAVEKAARIHRTAIEKFNFTEQPDLETERLQTQQIWDAVRIARSKRRQHLNLESSEAKGLQSLYYDEDGVLRSPWNADPNWD